MRQGVVKFGTTPLEIIGLSRGERRAVSQFWTEGDRTPASATCVKVRFWGSLTGIVLMVEMTGNYSLVLPFLVACLTAFGVADFLSDRPVYEALLERDLLRAQKVPDLDGTLLLDFTIAPGAPFDGKRVREIGLPPGAIIVMLRRRLREDVPTAESQLAAGDQISVLIAAEATAALPLLRKGTGVERE